MKGNYNESNCEGNILYENETHRDNFHEILVELKSVSLKLLGK